MRFMTWNLCQGTQRKFPLVAQHDVDVAVLCEASENSPFDADGTEPKLWAWTGDVAYKGLAISGLTTGGLAAPSTDVTGKHSIAATLDNGIGVLAIWTCPAKGSSYARELHLAINAHTDFLLSRPCIIAGDFNLDANLHQVTELRDAIAKLDALGYRSVYHSHFDVDFGHEPDATHYWLRKQDNRFHLDYVFASNELLERVTAVTVGTYEDWVQARDDHKGHSDHVPIIVDFAL
jgi:exodeoxyribonuclease III